MDYKTLTLEVIALAKETGKFFLEEINKVKISDIEVKGLHDFVSYVDKTAEARIVKKLAGILPESGFITEEQTATHRGERFNWIVDPLDGTTNFLHHIPLYSVSIALMEDDKIVIGVVYEPNLDECFYAWKGGNAYLNEKEIHVSDQEELKNTLLATGFPYNKFEKLNGYMELFTWFAMNTSGLRRLGSAAVDLCYTACGRFEGFYEYGLNAWDVAAGAFIVQQAGGTVTDFNGGDNYIFGAELLASNTLLHQPLLNAVESHFDKS
ncbi:MAG: inositol monophosphatase family protein [Lentimicrobiaceae bacterium]|jgi:myo-inositol-1(or 4)-monophosphatase